MAHSKYPLYMLGNLDPQADSILEEIAEANTPPLATLTPQQAREDRFAASWIGPLHDGVNVANRRIPRSDGLLPIRIYTPAGERPLPMLLFFHGGGFVACTLDEFDPFCTSLAAGASCIVVSVDYRLAPEHKHPAAVEDAVTAHEWIAAHAEEIHGDARRIAVAGDSAGGNLAAVLSLLARERKLPSLLFQVLICPWVDSSSFETESFGYFGGGLWLSKDSMRWYLHHYIISAEEALSPLVSPLLADDVGGLPPAFIVTAEFDVLRDQGEAYAHRLREAGVVTECIRYPGMLHDFVVFPGLFDRAKEAMKEITTALRGAFAKAK